MLFQPRYYQVEAVDAVLDYWVEQSGNPLVDMATGTGKSGTMAMLNHRILGFWPELRILSCTHVEELIAGNFEEFVKMDPSAPAGIYAASMGRRDAHSKVLFGQLQSIWNKADIIGHVDVMEIDEVHLVPSDGNTMYRKLIAALMLINPHMKIAGFTATPYRLDSGRLDEGEDRLFDRVVYTYSMRQGIDDGYLTRLTSQQTDMHYDTTGVRRLGGDFKKSELAEATDKEELTRAAVEEVMRYANVEGRKCAVFFCNGIEHATHVRDEVRSHGKSCAVLSGKTPKAERRQIIADLKAGRLWGCTSDNVLSTGTNIPCIDLIVDMAPTESCNRFVQRGGRGTRVIWPAGFNPETTDADGRKAAIARGPKPNCRYMNFAGNIERHGPIDNVTPKKPGEKGGEAPIKLCPKCEEINHASVRECVNCGHEFLFEEKPKFTARPSDAPVMSTDQPWSTVNGITFSEHRAKSPEKPSTVKASYRVGMRVVNAWYCPAHTGYPRALSMKYWKQHGGLLPFPESTTEWLARAGELRRTAGIQLDYSKNPKYPNIVGYRVADNDNVPVAANQNEPEGARERWEDELSDSIPF